MKIFNYLPLFLSVAFTLPAPEAESFPEANPLIDTRSCTHSSCSLLNSFYNSKAHHGSGSCVASCCAKSGCNGYLYCDNSYVSALTVTASFSLVCEGFDLELWLNRNEVLGQHMCLPMPI